MVGRRLIENGTMRRLEAKRKLAAAFSREKRRERGADGFGEWDGCVGIGRNCGEGRFGKNLGKKSLGMGANFVVDNLGRVTQSG